MNISFRVKDLKKVKFSYMGKELRDIYPHATRLQVIRYKFNKFMEKLIATSAAIALFIGMLYGSFKAGQSTTQANLTSAYSAPTDISDKIFSNKIESLKDGVVEELLSCESRDFNEDSGLVTYDPTDAQYSKLVNSGKYTVVDKGEMSFGILQFKKSTVIYYTKLKTGETITGKQALLIALDKKEAAELAKFVMFETKGKASGDWKNCANKLNLDSQIDIIKKLGTK